MLVYLHKINNPANQNSIVKAIKVTHDTLRNSLIPTMKENNVITVNPGEKFPWEKRIELTEKGKKIAECLEPCEHLLFNFDIKIKLE